MATERADVDLEVRLRGLFATGDLPAAATCAIRGYGPQILAYLCAVLRDRDDADDAFGRFAENLWNGLPEFRGESSFKTWSYKVAWHAALRVTRDPFHRRGERFATSEASRLAAVVRSSAALERSRVMGQLDRLREQLAPDEQTMLILRFDRDLSWREVGEVMGEEGDDVDETALRKRFERLKQKLRKMAEAEGIVDGDL